MCSGPVGFALTNSTLIVLPRCDSFVPKAAPASTIVLASAPAAAASSRMLMKPGPATSTLAMPGVSARPAAISVASSRGFAPTAFASLSAALEAQSP